MIQETSWERIEQIAARRGTCIRPGGMNNYAAMQDFRDSTVLYFSFQFIDGDNEERGYIRLVPVVYRGSGMTLVDFVSPWKEKSAHEALRELSGMEGIAPLAVPIDNAHESYKSDLRKIKQINLDEILLPSYSVYLGDPNVKTKLFGEVPQ